MAAFIAIAEALAIRWLIEENLRGLLDYCIKAKVKGIVCFGFGMTQSTCLEHGILYKKDEVFEYLQRFESKAGQLSMF
jgi:hypothetical protein